VTRYQEQFGEQGSHGHAHRLLGDAALTPGVVLDLGCSSGPLAEPVASLGHTYVGADVDRSALDKLAERGFESHELDLTLGEDELLAALERLLDGRSLAAVLLLDVLEHLVEPEVVLRVLGRLAGDHAGLRVVVSIPNVTHVDVGIKLLLGRWDLTDIGLLDDTHLRFFNHRLVHRLMVGTGWVEDAVDDVVNPFSDQLFPADAPALRPGTPLRQLLWRVRMAADPYGETYQFVRRYRFDLDTAAELAGVDDEATVRGRDDVFLTVLVQAPDAAPATGPEGLAGLLGDVARQADGDVEVLVAHHAGAAADVAEALDDAAVRHVVTPPGQDWRDAAVAEARGRYVAVLDHRTRLSSRYLTTLREMVEAMPGRVVQLGVRSASQADLAGVAEIDDVVGKLEAVPLDPLDLVTGAPFGPVALDGHAVPRQAWAVDGLHFTDHADEAAQTLFLLDAIELCGIVRSSEPVAVVHPSALRDLSADLDFLHKHLSLHPLVVPEGAGPQLLAFRQAMATVVPERDALAHELAAVRDQVGTLSLHLRSRDAELAQLREAWERRLVIRARRKLGALKRRLLRR
jgi:hypothetical protein